MVNNKETNDFVKTKEDNDLVNIKEDNDSVNNKKTNDFVKTKEDNDLVNIKDDNDFVNNKEKNSFVNNKRANNFINNKEANDFFNNINKKICVVYIQKTNLYDKTINISKHRNFIEIFDFFLLINNIILLYCNINGLYIKGLINNFDNKESLSEFISKKIEL